MVDVQWHGANALTVVYRPAAGGIAEEILYRQDEARLALVEQGRQWRFDSDGAAYRLVAEAHRIRLAHLFDPLLAVHTSLVEPLPHQITAVYEEMLPRQPLRFLLADDPGAGKTIMTGLLMKELIARGDLQRCLVVCPGSLAEQWQDELQRRFQLPFEILTNDKLQTARTGNWFLENDLVIARLDKLARDEETQAKLAVPDCRYDLVVVDEAHKVSARFFGGEITYTKRYRLGQLLSGITRHFLLLTATPHNGREEDFQLFLALLDGDRFEGRFRDGVHTVDVSDLMRRMVKENLLKFDGSPLFPERIAHSVPYKLSGAEAHLYDEVTSYVRSEFNRAETLRNDKRAGAVGFALTILQRRLASSPEAIYQSLRRRRERLQVRQQETERLHGKLPTGPAFDADDAEDLDEAPGDEVEATEAAILDQATAASTVAELQAEIDTLRRLEALAANLRRGGDDTKWRELSNLLTTLLMPRSRALEVAEGRPRYHGSGAIPPPVPSHDQKLVVFTEHRDTLNELQRRIGTVLGRPDAVVVIHGGLGRDERRRAQEAFLQDRQVHVLLATDAAGEGINLQRAHLMVNYDLPWNPNRLEQRFGRIHRIGQTEVCHLWNLVAADTREGDVYRTLLDKLEQARFDLGGQVFDVLGKLQFGGRHLRELLIEAIRYGDEPAVRARLSQAVAAAVDRPRLQALIEERALAQDSFDSARVAKVREDMERAEARRLQPHYVESFFLAAFRKLGGTVREREPRRYEVSHVPAAVRTRGPSRRRTESKGASSQPCPGAGARLNSGEARRRADDLQERLHRRMAQLDSEAQISALPPTVIGGAAIVPLGLILAMRGRPAAKRATDTQAAAARARAVVMSVERSLGFEPADREFERLGYDIESRIPGTGKLRFIEVKGRVEDAESVTVTRNEVLTPEQARRLHPCHRALRHRRQPRRALCVGTLRAGAGFRCGECERRAGRAVGAGEVPR